MREQEEEGLLKMREVRTKKLKRHPNKRTGKMNFQEFTTLQRISLLTLNCPETSARHRIFLYVAGNSHRSHLRDL